MVGGSSRRRKTLHKPTFGQKVLLSSGKQTFYERETRKRKPTPKSDVLGQRRITAAQRITLK